MSNVVDDIKAKLDIIDYIQRFVPLKKAGQYHKACCPFHAEQTASFMVSAARQSWHCYGSCATGGDIFAFVMRYHNWTFSEALAELAKLAGVDLQVSAPVKAAYLDKLRGLIAAAAESYEKCLWEYPGAQTARDYIASRGLSVETCQRFGVGFAPDHWHAMTNHLTGLGHMEKDILTAGIALKSDKGKVYDAMRNRLIIPIRDERGRVVGFAGRTLNQTDQPKYLNTGQTPLFDKGKLLFGFQREAIRGSTAVIVEGYMDAMQAHQAGFTNVVAQMGTALTDTQVKLLDSAARIVIALDGDAAGLAAARRDLEQAIKSGKDVRILTLHGGRDPDDVIRAAPEEWALLVDEAQPVADFVIDQECASLSESASVPEREALVKKLLPVLIAAESDIYRKVNIQKLAMRLKLPAAELMALAKPPAQKPVLAEAQPVTIPDRSPIEGFVLRGLIMEEGSYAQVLRTFRELELPILCESDFASIEYRTIFSLWVAALAQEDAEPISYLYDALDVHLKAVYGEIEEQAISLKMIVEQALRLRLYRIRAEVEELLAIENFSQVRSLNRERGAIMERLRA